MPKNSFCFFQNLECQYFPCHKTEQVEAFNCLFCYCPLYALADQCGGNFTYTESGVKDCSGCMIPHGAGGYTYITDRFSKLAALASRSQSQETNSAVSGADNDSFT